MERARSTTLALLGLTAAVGLGMVALALNQGWPLIAGAPIPGFMEQHQGVGDATVAATARESGVALGSPTGRHGSKSSTSPPGHGAGPTAPAGSRTPGPKSIVVSHSAPVSLPDDGSPGGAAPSPVPTGEQPAGTAAPPPSSPPPPPTSAPASPPSPAPAPTLESPASPDPPQSVLSSDDPTGHEHGHRFGRGTSRGYGHSHRDDPDDSVVAEDPSSVPDSPDSPDAPPAEPDAPEEPESDESRTPSWSHGSGHGYRRDRDYGHRW